MRLNWRKWCGAAAMLALSISVQAADDAAADGRQCGPGEEREGDVCYAGCKEDGYTRYEGDGEMCWEICPSNSQDYGNVCLMGPAQLKKKRYNRGPGRPLS